MDDTTDSLEDLIRRPTRPGAGLPQSETPGSTPFEACTIGLCDCGARITDADLYGERGGADLGQPRRSFATRIYQYRCPLCGNTGEFPSVLVDG